MFRGHFTIAITLLLYIGFISVVVAIESLKLTVWAVDEVIIQFDPIAVKEHACVGIVVWALENVVAVPLAGADVV